MNISQVTGYIFRGPSPISPEDFQQLERFGIKIIVDLQDDDLGTRLWRSGRAAEFQMDTIGVPMGEIFPPTKVQQDLVYWHIRDGIRANKSIYVHCRRGKDRTGMVIAYFRIHAQNFRKAVAVYEMKKMGMAWWLYWWSWFL